MEKGVVARGGRGQGAAASGAAEVDDVEGEVVLMFSMELLGMLFCWGEGEGGIVLCCDYALQVSQQ